MNYESQWWGFIYDQMMQQDLPHLLAAHLRFYRDNLQGVNGPILECACGTGLFLLPLLADGFDIFGFDISEAMLSTLKTKAQNEGFVDIENRISVQNFTSFEYTQQFDAILIPTNSFSMLTTQEEQIATLQRIHAHLKPNGKLLLDLRLADMRHMVDGSMEGEGSWHEWMHPETKRPIRQMVNGRIDHNQQLITDECFIEYDGQKESFLMNGRYIFKDEFQLLLRLAGFSRWEAYSTPQKDPLTLSVNESMSYWIAHK